MRSLRARLSIWSVLVLAAIIAALGAFVTVRLRSDLVQRVDRSLDAGALVLRRAFDREGPVEFKNTSGAILHSFPYQPSASQILDLQGSIVVFRGDAGSAP